MPFYMHRRGVSCLILLALRSLGTLKKTSLPSISQRMNCERWWWDTEKAKPGPCSFHLSCSYNVSRIKLLISIPLLPRSLPSSFPFQNFNPRRLNKKKQASDWNDGRKESFVRLWFYLLFRGVRFVLKQKGEKQTKAGVEETAKVVGELPL